MHDRWFCHSENRRYGCMKRNRIAAGILLGMMINSAFAAGCAGRKEKEETASTEPFSMRSETETSFSGKATDTTENTSSDEESVMTSGSAVTPSTEETSVTASLETTEPMTETTEKPSETEASSVPSDTGDPSDPLSEIRALRKKITGNASYYDSLDNTMKESWCFQRKKDHSVSGSYEFFKIKDFNGAYINDHVPEGDKVIYLTFDCGYPSDKTEPILDILQKHNVKASFFVTKMYLEKCSDYAVRMKEEGHMVCNHTVTHSDLVPMSVEQIAGEIFDVAEYFYEKTGYTLDPYFRTPKGTYTKRLMTIISDAGYKTVFWSIAYNDYTPSAQPEPGYVLDHFQTYHHNGAIALMHNDSQSNVNELDAVLKYLEKEGYRFGLLNELEEN